MKIEKSSLTEIYNVETEKYDIATKYYEDFDIGYSGWEILSVQDKDGLEVKLTKEEENKLKDSIVNKIMEL
jgi:hypothetical protein